MTYHPLTEKVRKMFDDKGFVYDVFEHEAVRTSEEASKVRTGYTIEQGAKALIVRVKKAGEGKKFVMIVVPGDKKFDSEKMKVNFGLSDMRFATQEEAQKITDGIEFGGVPPLGNLFGLEVYVEKMLLQNERIIFNAGDRCFSIGMKSSDYIEFVNPQIGDIT